MKKLIVLISSAVCMALGLFSTEPENEIQTNPIMEPVSLDEIYEDMEHILTPVIGPEAPESFTVREEDGTDREILLEHCNSRYEEDGMIVYSYDTPDKKGLYFLTPEAEKVIYPLTDYLIDQEQGAIWIQEGKENPRISRIDLKANPCVFEKMMIDGEIISAAIARIYGLSRENEETSVWDLDVTLLRDKESPQEGRIKCMASKAAGEKNKRYYMLFEMDKNIITARGYLQNLSLPVLYQEFLYHNLTAENSFPDKGRSRELSFFDEEIYGGEFTQPDKRFALYDYNGDGTGELLFQISQENGDKEVIYVLGKEGRKLICLDIIEKADTVREDTVWFRCEEFCDIPVENYGKCQSRDEVFSAMEKGDFTNVDMGEKYSYIKKEDLQEEDFLFLRCDVNQDGAEELVCQIKNEIWEDGMAAYIFTCRNGKAVCIYYDGSDGNEWLTLGENGKLYYNLIITAPYHVRACYACSLDTAGYKVIDYGLEAITVFDEEGGEILREKYPEMVRNYPEMVREGTHYIKVWPDTDKEGGTSSSQSERKEKMISQYEFLKEHQKLTGENIFLKELGLEGKTPYYQYFQEDGELQMELYLDGQTGIGCGIRYYPETNWKPQGFLFQKEGEPEFLNFLEPDRTRMSPYTTLSVEGSDGKSGVENYKEITEYTEDGKLDYYKSEGCVTWLGDGDEVSTLLEIDFIYRENGTLKERRYHHNGGVFMTFASYLYSFYDSSERLVYEDCYITHGSVDYYYIYDGESRQPKECLILDHNLDMLIAELIPYS